jgi:RHS repeat-associated protein
VIAETSNPTEESAQLFTGQTLEGRSGLYDFQARWYDPGSGTFLSVDPVVGDAFDPQAYNAYAYARNNPVNLTDPTGMCIMADCGKWYGQVPGGMSLSQVSNGSSAQFLDPGFLADFGAAPGMFVSDFVSGSSPPSFSEFFGRIADTAAGVFDSLGGGDGPFPTDLVNTRTLPGGMTEFTFVPEDILGGRGVGLFNLAGATSQALGAAALLSEAHGWLASAFPSTARYTAPLRTAARNYLVPFAAFVDSVSAWNHSRRGEGHQAFARGTDAAAGIGIAFGVPALFAGAGVAGGGPVAWGLGATYVGIGGFDGVVTGVGHLCGFIIRAGPNGPLR